MVLPHNAYLPLNKAASVGQGAAAPESTGEHKQQNTMQPTKPQVSTSLFLKVFYAIALVPLLYVVSAYVCKPIGQSFGHFLVHQFGPQSTPYTHVALEHGMHQHTKRIEKGSGEYIAFIVLIPVLVILSGIFAGLTLGYMSLDMTQLTILASSGTEKQKKHALKIIPVRKNGHLLLTTLLLVNMIVNETLPVISDPVLGGGVQAVVVSTVLIIIFSEIIPQSICSRYGLVVGSSAAPATQILIYLFYPIAWPISWILEKLLGNHNGIIYRKGELRELLNLHAARGHNGGDLMDDTIGIAQGALDLQDKVARDAMTPLSEVFMLEDTTRLDYEVLTKIVRSGHSRIPVFKYVSKPDLEKPGKVKVIKKILGIVLVKNFVLLDPEDATPIMSVPLNLFPSVAQDEPLLNMLNNFQEGRSHLAIVSRRTVQPKTLPQKEDDVESVMIETAALGLKDKLRHTFGLDSDSSDEESDLEMGNVKKSKGDLKKQREAERKAAKMHGQGVPGDAQMAPGKVQEFIEDLEGEPLGLITLEDVLEELIGEEIADEYDAKNVTTGDAEAAYIPAEAEAAIAAAQESRDAEKQRSAVATAPAPVKIQPTKSNAQGIALVNKLGAIGRRATSQPGRKRTADLSAPAPAPVPTGAGVSTGSPNPATLKTQVPLKIPPTSVEQAETAQVDEKRGEGFPVPKKKLPFKSMSISVPPPQILTAGTPGAPLVATPAAVEYVADKDSEEK